MYSTARKKQSVSQSSSVHLSEPTSFYNRHTETDIHAYTHKCTPPLSSLSQSIHLHFPCAGTHAFLNLFVCSCLYYPRSFHCKLRRSKSGSKSKKSQGKKQLVVGGSVLGKTTLKGKRTFPNLIAMQGSLSCHDRWN